MNASVWAEAFSLCPWLMVAADTVPERFTGARDSPSRCLPFDTVRKGYQQGHPEAQSRGRRSDAEDTQPVEQFAQHPRFCGTFENVLCVGT